MSLTSKLTIGVDARQIAPGDLANASVPLTLVRAIALASGTGAGQADKIWHDRRTLAASATEDLDLAGVLTDAVGQAFTLARVKALIVIAAAANANNVIIGDATSNPWSTALGADGTVVVRPGGVFALAAPDATAYAVTAGTGDLLKIANSAGGTSVTYDIVIIGASA